MRNGMFLIKDLLVFHKEVISKLNISRDVFLRYLNDSFLYLYGYYVCLIISNVKSTTFYQSCDSYFIVKFLKILLILQ